MGKFLVVIVPAFVAGVALSIAMFRIGDAYPATQAPMIVAAASLAAIFGARLLRDRSKTYSPPKG